MGEEAEPLVRGRGCALSPALAWSTMKADMRTMLLAATLGVTLTACGEGGETFRSPSDARFEYGAERTPTAGEVTAARQLAAAAVGTLDLAAEAGTPSAPEAAFGEATSSMMISGVVLPGSAEFADSFELSQESIDEVSTALLQRRPAADWSQDCWTATPSTITLGACRQPVDDSGSGTVTGALTPSGHFDLSAGHLTWGASVDVDLHDASGFRVFGAEDLNGSMTWTNAILTGHARVDVSLLVYSYGQGDPHVGKIGWHEWHQLWRGVTYAADYDLTYAAASVCASRVTGGTITVKRLWAVRPPMAVGDAFDDASIRFTWSGCGDVSTNLTVASSSREI